MLVQVALAVVSLKQGHPLVRLRLRRIVERLCLLHVRAHQLQLVFAATQTVGTVAIVGRKLRSSQVVGFAELGAVLGTVVLLLLSVEVKSATQVLV